MNEELIQRLVDQCVVKRERHGTTVDVLQSRPFAELIVKECVQVAIEQKKLAEQPTFNYQDATWDRARIQQSDLIIHKIKEHFGIEE